ncbi:MAG: 50S ribosomal protein L11 methyltransferase [Gammaproteobacteria bacterium]|nr:50S ribosomal protein L11 methyltransferase [Gammaproteobacteria bacterium]
MAWKQLQFHTSTDKAGRLSDLLTKYGASAVTFVDDGNEPVLEPGPGEVPLWDQTCVVGLFEDDVDLDDVLQKLSAKLAPAPLPVYEISDLPDQDWERAWLADFKPMQFGQRLWIVPTAYDAQDENAVNIRLDPGLAFGTGTHPTTALCLTWLDGHDVQGRSVLDFGCGSGILAIAAAKLGAKKVSGVDIDPQAVTATRDNARLNDVTAIEVSLSSDYRGGLVDILLANILANPLKMLAAEFAQRVKPGGDLVMSGILAEQAAEVAAAYVPWFDMDAPQQQDDWVLLHGRRRTE